MYGTIAKMKTGPGALEALRAMESRRAPGLVSVHVLQADENASEVWMVALFDSKESYVANAESPEQDREYRALRANLLEDPEWHDGQVIYSGD